ncbi:glycosyltransferase family 4 protein [Paraburkholderia sp.]|uniref:glycosyltransferase family 4 protein n=1 Tax=Paraburkholderia sp. TaxID=1926495 RepID=UPI0023A151DE|nr:glycosyltransferase family 4 protein [Paraburkholderia sp.]MDE1182983.1 glycosyltransferase family 4 protein [Paraburkholderia sp.]
MPNPHANARLQQEIVDQLLKPSDKTINDAGARLPEALLGLWASLGYGYQKMYPLNDMASVDDFTFWWLHWGHKEHPGFGAHINRYLVDALHADAHLAMHGETLKQGVSPLIDLLYRKRDDLKIIYSVDGKPQVDSLLEWWYTFGFREYRIPNFGLSLDLMSVLSEVDGYGDFGYGEQFTRAPRYLFQYIGAWRQEYDIYDVVGTTGLIQHIVTELVETPDELRVFFTTRALDSLAELTNDFTEFDNDGFRKYCFAFCTWGQQDVSPDADAWWTATGQQQCRGFIAALKGQTRGISGFVDRQHPGRHGAVRQLIDAAKAAYLSPDRAVTEPGPSASLPPEWAAAWHKDDAAGSFGYGDTFTGITRHLYATVEAWRRVYDFNLLSGVTSLLRHVVLDLTHGPDDLFLTFNTAAIHTLSRLTADFRDFDTAEFKRYCFDFWMWTKPADDIDVNAWWDDTGRARFSGLVQALIAFRAATLPLDIYLNEQRDISRARGDGPSVSMIGYPHGAFGIGEDARLVGKALEIAGLKSETYMSARKIISASPEFEKFPPVTQYAGSDVTIFCMPAFDTLALLHDFGPYPFTTGYRIGLWQWELQEFPDEAMAAFSLVDEIWTISEHAALSFRKKTDKPVHVIPLPVASDLITPVARSTFGIPEDAFLFGFAFDGASFIARKNPLALVEAFQRAFPKSDTSVCLLIKAMNSQNESIWKECLYRADTDPRIVVVDEVLSRGEANGLLNACDCIVSLHRAEGFGRVMAEALYMGKPVITSRYSGPLDFVTDDTAYLVDGDLVDIKPDDYPFWKGNRWFQPDIQQAADVMRDVRKNPDERQAKAAAGRISIRADYSPQACAKFVSARFKEISGAGDQK